MTQFAELLDRAGVREATVLRSTVGFMAIHGGSLERGTAEIATAAAEAGGASLYTVEQPPDLRWHLPSHLIGGESSPVLAAFLEHVDVVVSIHGYGREGSWTRILAGGADRGFATRVAVHLRASVPGFEVVDDIECIPRELRGLHPANPVNLARGGGVQLELPPRIRGIGPNARADLTTALVDGLAGVCA
ncbi:MAG: poly-gamma-glutamate hydrolase family protein [Acidimicrobiia bacterium]